MLAGLAPAMGNLFKTALAQCTDDSKRLHAILQCIVLYVSELKKICGKLDGFDINGAVAAARPILASSPSPNVRSDLAKLLKLLGEEYG